VRRHLRSHRHSAVRRTRALMKFDPVVSLRR
jgi:hypothetical protein